MPSAANYGLLVVATTMCSSAGTVFALLYSPPFLKAGYRLTFQTLFQLVPWLLSHPAPAGSWQKHYPHVLFSGICLGSHFSSWVYSLEHTSLTHSLLFVSMHPIILNVYYHLALRWGVGRRPTGLETMGSLVGVAGAALMMLDIKEEGSSEGGGDEAGHEPTFWGDFVAFLGAVFMAAYLLVGEKIRTKEGWSLWTYVQPVTAVSTLACWLYSWLLDEEELRFFCLEDNCVLGCFSPNDHVLYYSIYLGLFAGIGERECEMRGAKDEERKTRSEAMKRCEYPGDSLARR